MILNSLFGSNNTVIDNIKLHLSIIQDSQQSVKVNYRLFDILFGILCDVITGARGWTDIRKYVLGHHEWFRRHQSFEKDVPVDEALSLLLNHRPFGNVSSIRCRRCTA